jgi:3-oxoacyl-[acyl-carrier-protein] synthase I
MKPVAILASGMVTAVGLNSPASCAAIRCAIDNFTETRFMDKGGEWIIGAQVPLEQPWRGLPKLVHMVVPAINECREWLATVETTLPATEVPLLLCVAEKERPGRLEGLDDRLFEEIQKTLGIRFHPQSTVIPQGRVAGAMAMELARRLLYEENVPYCIIAGTDTFLIAQTLAAYEAKSRLLTSQNSNGFIPGEAGAAILVGRPRNNGGPEPLCVGIGSGVEKATLDSADPLRADGLTQAIKSAFSDAGCGYDKVDFRLTDANGEQYWFKEAALAMTRTMRVRKEAFDIWHPADCIGETGAASGVSILTLAVAATQKGYSAGPGILCQMCADDGSRRVLVLQSGALRNT